MVQKKVMLVDDSAMMRIVLRNLLRNDPNLLLCGAMENGRVALGELDQVQPDLVLLDLEMPEMDGLEFLRQARARTNAKVIVLSSVTPSGSPKAAQALDLGADAVITKPSGAVSFDPEAAQSTELFRTIHRLLGAD